MRTKLVVAVVAVLAIGSVTVGAIGADELLGDTAPAAENDTFAFDGASPVELEASENATVSGTTTLDAGTELSVRVQSADDSGPRFFKSAAATVGDDGAFTATFDLSEIRSEREVNVSVRAQNTTEQVDGRVVAPEGGFSDSTESDDDPVSFDGGESVELAATENATLSGTTTAEAGSEIAVRIQSADDGTRFFVSRAVTVESDGSFTATFDLGDLYEQREIEISVVGDEWTHQSSGTVVAPEDGFPDADTVEATVDGDEPIRLAAASNQTVSGTTNLDAGTEVSVDLRNASNGRLLAVGETTVDEEGAFTASLDLSTVEAGQDVTIELSVYREPVATAEAHVAEE